MERRTRNPDPLTVPLRRFFDRATTFFAVLRPDGVLLRFNQAVRETLGEAAEDPVGLPIWDTFWYRDDPEQRERLRATVAEAAAGGLTQSEVLYRVGEGTRRWADATFHGVSDARGKVRYLLVEGHDVSSRKRAEESARRGELQLRAIIDNMAGFVGIAETDGRLTHANRSALAATGLSEQDVVGKPAWEVSSLEAIPGEAGKVRAMFQAALEGRPVHGEIRFRGALGQTVYADAAMTPVLDDDGRVVSVVIDSRDMTERVHAAEELARSEARYRALFEQSRDGVFVVTMDGVVSDLNEAALAMLGCRRDAAIGSSLAELLADETLAAEVFAEARKGNARPFEFVREGTGGAKRELKLIVGHVRTEESEPVMLQAILRDLTEQHQLERGLSRSQQLESMGRVAASVAHEINNPLTWVLANVDEAAAALKDAGRDPRASLDAKELAQLLGEAADGARRIARIVRELRVLGRPETEEMVEVEVGAVIHEALTLARGEVYDRARVSIENAGSLRVRIGDGRLLQVVLNLLLNAAKAIPAGDPGQNEIRVRTVAAGDTARIEVSDTGCGIPSEHLERLFEPFFTTRDVGEGSGLGLWVCERIVRAARGRIEVESTPGKGSRFTVILPRVGHTPEGVTSRGESSLLAEPSPMGHASSPAVDPATSATAASDAHGSKSRVLVIDDEPRLRALMARVLRREHEVETAGGASEALSLLERDGRFDLILCDLMMPVIDGVGFYERLERTRSSLADRLTFMTGGACNDGARKFLESRDLPWLQKPFENRDLLRFVRDLIDRFGEDSA